MSGLYRVGHHQARHVYRGEEHIGVMFAPGDAALVVSMLNGVRPIKAVTDLLHCANELIGDDRRSLLRNQVDNGCGWCGRDHLADLRRVFGSPPKCPAEPDALIDRDGSRWDRFGPDAYQLDGDGIDWSRALIQDSYGPVTEVWG